MSDSSVLQQAGELVSMISKLMRSLYTLETGDLANELSVAHLRACNALMESPRSITELARELGTSTSATTQLADRLHKAGIVERVVAPDDRRVKLLHLTSHGKQLIGARRARRVERMEKALDRLSVEQRGSVLEALTLLTEAGNAVKLSEAEKG